LYLNRGFLVDAGIGNGTLYVSGGGGGSFAFAHGDGHDHLIDNQWYSGRADNLLLSTLRQDEVSVSISENALTIHIDGTADSFTADNQFSGVPGIGLNQVVSSDGSAWSWHELSNRTHGSSVAVDTESQTLAATSSADTFTLGSSIGSTVITAFAARSSRHDYLQVSRNQFSDWAHLLGATQ